MTDGRLSGDHDTWSIRDAPDLGRAIAQARKAAGLTQGDLAERAGITRQYLSDLERGRTTEQTDRLFRLLRRLGLTVTVERRETS